MSSNQTLKENFYIFLTVSQDFAQEFIKGALHLKENLYSAEGKTGLVIYL